MRDSDAIARHSGAARSAQPGSHTPQPLGEVFAPHNFGRGVWVPGALLRGYFKLFRTWFWLGWPAFLGVIAIFALMVWNPTR
jgi:hypothetical protein